MASFRENPDALCQFEGIGGAPLDQTMEDRAGSQSGDRWRHVGFAEKEAAVQQEMKRMSQLPANSTYVSHRLRVLNKILQLLAIQRTTSQEEELELLFAGLSM